MTDFIDFATLTRPASPNTALLAPEGTTPKATPDGPAPVFKVSPADLFERARKHAEGRKDWRLAAADGRKGRIRFVAITSFFKFKDDVDLAILPHGDSGSTLIAYSRSRVGYSDMGANAKRLGALMKALEQG